MNMKKLIIPLILCCINISIYNNAFAQINTEKIRKQDENNGFNSTVSLLYNLEAGNSSNLNLAAALRFDYKNDLTYIFMDAHASYKKYEDKISANKAFLHLRYNYNPSEIVTWEIFAQKNFNKSIKLDDRNLIGSGLRFPLSTESKDSSSKFFMALGLLGFMYEYELYNIKESNTSKCFRTTNYINLTLNISKSLDMSFTSYYQAKLSNFKDFRIIADLALNFHISANLDFSVNSNLRFDNSPLTGLKKYDFEMLNGISYKF